MKKVFTMFACALMAMNAAAQTPDVELSKKTINMETSTNNEYFFNGSGFTYKPLAGRDPNKAFVCADGWADGINFQNNKVSTITIPDGQAIYRIMIKAFSQSDEVNQNCCYIAGYGEGEQTVNGHGFEWVDPIGVGVKDNNTIKTKAKYPVYYDHAAEYSIDFGNEPYTGTFSITFSGNNQESAAYYIWTSRSSADAASTGISSVQAVKATDNAYYNLAGQKVNKNFKGIVLHNGKKYINR